MTTESTLDLTALKRWVFEDDPSLLLVEQLKELRLESLIYPLLKERGTPENDFEALYRNAAALNLKQRGMLQQITSVLAQHQVRWVPIKGADLAWRVWPASLCRTQCDLDLLVHPDDCVKALDLLQKSGWTTPYRYSNVNHEAMMKRHGVALELHFKFPEFDRIDMRKLWEFFIPQGNGIYRLPLELNLLMLFAHSRGHRWSNGIQLLLDCGFLLKHEGMPDWDKLRSDASRCHVASPELFFCAVPDFFPAKAIPGNDFSAEQLAIFRRLLFTPPVKVGTAESVMSESARGSLAWWWKRFKGMSPASIRMQTGNPRGHYGKLLIGYWQISCRKIRDFRHYRHGSADSQLLTRQRDEAEIENLLRGKDLPNALGKNNNQLISSIIQR